MSLNYTEFQARDRRLVILRALAAAALYTSNAYVLRSFCASVGHVVTAEQLDGDLEWLREQALVKLDRPAADLVVATLTARGRDTAEGTLVHPGVARPTPGG